MNLQVLSSRLCGARGRGSTGIYRGYANLRCIPQHYRPPSGHNSTRFTLETRQPRQV